MTNPRKRPRQTTSENRAECPFSIVLDQDLKKVKKRRRQDSEEPPRKIFSQLSPFSPSGRFKTHETLDLSYAVEPSAKWQEMTRYNSFVLNGAKYFSEGFIFVANESTIERQQAPDPDKPRKRSKDDWVARILEIRASDEHHVYARVYWMYWPDELPVGTSDGKKYIQGRQPYHGHNELIASNHMDIINVVSVTSPAIVNHWVEENDDEVQSALYWRQAFDCRNLELSTVEPVCKCNSPQHPDKILVRCSNEKCDKWLHDECLIHDALLRTYEQLGKTKPHISTTEPVKVKEEEGGVNRPLSPTEPATGETQQTIDVKAAGEKDNVQVKQSEEAASTQPSPEATPATPTQSTPAVTTRGSVSKKPRVGKATNGYSARERATKPYLGLFEASLRMDTSPPEIEIRDLRENIDGGDKTWSEPLACLICSTPIN